MAPDNLAKMLNAQLKKELLSRHGKSENDTGSSEVQAAIFTHRINHLLEHLQRFRKDRATQRMLLKLVSKRKRILDYLRRTDLECYRALIKTLDIRK